MFVSEFSTVLLNVTKLLIGIRSLADEVLSLGSLGIGVSFAAFCVGAKYITRYFKTIHAITRKNTRVIAKYKAL